MIAVLFSCGSKQRASPRVHPDDPLGAPTNGASHLVTSLGVDEDDADAIKRRVGASSGMAAGLRFTVWPVLLGLDADGATSREEKFATLLDQAGTSVDKSLVTTIDADVPRTEDLTAEQQRMLRELLLAHCVLQPVWGYFQGMHDMASVVLHACENMERGSESVASRAFWLLRGVLLHCAENWSYADLQGVWRQARAVRGVLREADAKLAQKLGSLEDSHSADQPLAFLFGPIFLRLKRETIDMEQAMRLWEVSWANGKTFDVLLIAALVRTQRSAIMSLRAGPSASAQLHQLFGKLRGTQRAAPLLEEARRLQANAKCLAAVEAELTRQLL